MGKLQSDICDASDIMSEAHSDIFCLWQKVKAEFINKEQAFAR